MKRPCCQPAFPYDRYCCTSPLETRRVMTPPPWWPSSSCALPARMYDYRDWTIYAPSTGLVTGQVTCCIGRYPSDVPLSRQAQYTAASRPGTSGLVWRVGGMTRVDGGLTTLMSGLYSILGGIYSKCKSPPLPHSPAATSSGRPSSFIRGSRFRKCYQSSYYAPRP